MVEPDLRDRLAHRPYTDAVAANDVQVANMSLGDAGSIGTCTMVLCARRSARPSPQASPTWPRLATRLWTRPPSSPQRCPRSSPYRRSSDLDGGSVATAGASSPLSVVLRRLARGVQQLRLRCRSHGTRLPDLLGLQWTAATRSANGHQHGLATCRRRCRSRPRRNPDLTPSDVIDLPAGSRRVRQRLLRRC